MEEALMTDTEVTERRRGIRASLGKSHLWLSRNLGTPQMTTGTQGAALPLPFLSLPTSLLRANPC